MKNSLLPSLCPLMVLFCAPLAVLAEEPKAFDESALRPGLVVTEYPRHSAQIDQNHLFISREQLGKPIGAPYLTDSLAPWKWDTERNAEAAGYINIRVDGDYRFITRSSYDRNVLIIGDKEVCPFGDGENTVATIPLKKGWVKIVSRGFAASGGQSGIFVRWQPPGQAELSPIPSPLLWHEGDGEPILGPRESMVKPAKEPAKPDPSSTRSAPRSASVLATELITVVDDFIVEVYKNGTRIPDTQRKVLEEIFGATVERISVDVAPGDWLVFHVVNNRLRWDGVKYFATAGKLTPHDFGFVSDPASNAWSVCDDPARAREFIRRRDEGTEIRAGAIARPWDQGDTQMRKHAGQGFPGKALWGGASSTWIKFIADKGARKPLPIPSPDSTFKSGPVTKEKLTPAAEKKPALPKVALSLSNEPSVIASPTRWPVQVLSAIYGTGGKNADVTARVKELVETKRCFFSVDPPTLGADPNPYWNKSLHIVYMKDGVRREQRRNENEHVLPESFYGPQDAFELAKWLPASRWRSSTGDIQFHANHTVTGPGIQGAPIWEALAPNKLRIDWSAERKVEYLFDYTWSSFRDASNAATVYYVMK